MDLEYKVILETLFCSMKVVKPNSGSKLQDSSTAKRWKPENKSYLLQQSLFSKKISRSSAVG